MASSTLVKDLLERVSVQLHDASPQFTQWTQRELVHALNDGQRAIAKYLPPSCSRVDVIKLTAGTRQSISRIAAANVIAGDGSAVTADIIGNNLQHVIRNMGSNGATPGRAILITDHEALDSADPYWHSSTGNTILQYTFDPKTPDNFYVVPGVPAGSNVWAEISYLSDPVEVPLTGDYGVNSASTTKISIDDKYVDDLVNYILARAYIKDAEYAGEGGLASAHAQMFLSSLNAQAQAMTGINPNLQSLPMQNAATPAARG